MRVRPHILPTIVIAQFCCTSLWFASNGILGELTSNFGLDANALANLTSAVQFGFITGTLVFAILTITDRFSPSKVFLVSAILGAIFNAGMLWQSNTLFTLLIFRFFTGFFLAGIYPVGMKIAADYFDRGLGKSLGFLVGALVLGTAFPHILKSLGTYFSWQSVVTTTSGLALFGGLSIVFLVPNGPYRKQSQQVDLNAFFKVFQHSKFRSSAFGYFGHMWELYTFWAFVPVILVSFNNMHGTTMPVSLWSFIIIALGGVACVLGGFISMKAGTKKTATLALLMSGLCCLLSPLVFGCANPYLLLIFLCIWGMVVIADSPLFSTLVAGNADAQIKGTALTIVNCIGFAITIVSIQVMTWVQQLISWEYSYLLLALGPLFGLYSLYEKNKF